MIRGEIRAKPMAFGQGVLFFEFILISLNSFFFFAPRSKRGNPTFICLLCVSSFSYYYMTYFYNLSTFVFSGAQLGCAPARHFSLRVNPGISKFP